MNNEGRRVKAETTKQLAEKHGVSEKVFRTWIAPIQHLIGPRIGHHYTPRQVDIIDKHVAGAFLLLFGSFFKSSEAMAGADAANSDNLDFNNAKNSIHMIPETSNLMYPVLFLMGLAVSIYFMVINIKNLIQRFIDTPANRELAIVRSHDKTARVKDILQISNRITVITLVCVAIVVAGYWVGISILKS